MYRFDDLIKIVRELRSEHGCIWDREQTHDSLKVCLAEESREVLAAIELGDMENLCEELGDLLFQVLIHSQIAAEHEAFTIDQVVDGICCKMVRRHPHVFGNTRVNSPEEAMALWEQIKKQEKPENP